MQAHTVRRAKEPRHGDGIGWREYNPHRSIGYDTESDRIARSKKVPCLTRRERKMTMMNNALSLTCPAACGPKESTYRMRYSGMPLVILRAHTEYELCNGYIHLPAIDLVCRFFCMCQMSSNSSYRGKGLLQSLRYMSCTEVMTRCTEYRSSDPCSTKRRRIGRGLTKLDTDTSSSRCSLA